MNEKVKGRKVENPPFPTFLPTIEEDAGKAVESVHAGVAKGPIEDDIYHPKMFRFTSPSIMFTEEHETKAPARDRSRAKLAKVKK